MIYIHEKIYTIMLTSNLESNNITLFSTSYMIIHNINYKIYNGVRSCAPRHC